MQHLAYFADRGGIYYPFVEPKESVQARPNFGPLAKPSLPPVSCPTDIPAELGLRSPSFQRRAAADA